MPAAAKQDWQTPEWIVEKIHRIFPEGFYDPCTDKSNPTRAAVWRTPEDASWGHGFQGVPPRAHIMPKYYNPPFGSLYHWVMQAVEVSVHAPVVLLVPLRTHTPWYQKMIVDWCVLAYVHLAKRVVFRGAKAGYREPIALFFLASTWNGETYGSKTLTALDAFYDEFRPHGYLYKREIW